MAFCGISRKRVRPYWPLNRNQKNGKKWELFGVLVNYLFPGELLFFPVDFLNEGVDFVLWDRGEHRVSREDDLFLNPGGEE